MKKTYVLDTNVFLYDPNALYGFADNDLAIPITVIEELDQFKKNLNGLGRNARQVSRQLDELRKKGDLAGGVDLKGEDRGKIRVVFGSRDLSQLPYGFNKTTEDNRILEILMTIKETEEDQPVRFVSRDTNMRLKANALGIPSDDYKPEKIEPEKMYSGMRHIEAEETQIEKLRQGNELKPDVSDLLPNQHVLMTDVKNAENKEPAYYNHFKKVLEPVPDFQESIWGIMPRNIEQRCAFNLLLKDNVKLVTLAGVAGTGKTLLALACGLHKVTEENKYFRMLVSRPIYPMGKDIGFLPGDVQEKLHPWMQPIFDNLELIMGGTKPGRDKYSGYASLMDMGILEIEALTYIRGRSIPGQYIIIDETQNLNPLEIKTIITRAGEKTKIVLTGDLYQIDNPFLDSTTNGLSYVIERMKGDPLIGHVTLVKGERSLLAEAASKRL